MSVRSTRSAIVSALPILLFIFSCNDDNERSQECLLKKVTSKDFLIYDITRNDEGLILKVDYEYLPSQAKVSSVFEYDAAGRVEKILEQNSFRTYEYSGTGKVIFEESFHRTDASSPFSSFKNRTFSYNEQDILDSVIHSDGQYASYERNAEGNINRVYRGWKGSSESLLTEYSFDNKKNPFGDLPILYTVYVLGEASVITTSLNPPAFNINNVVSSKAFSNTGEFQVSSITYTYNDAGYPATINGETYEYDCK